MLQFFIGGLLAIIDGSVRQAVSDILDLNEYVLYDIDYEQENARFFLRVYIERKDQQKINVDDCVKANVLIGKFMDKNDPIDGEYILEVASPGIIRKLRTVEHFKAVLGDKISITLDKKIKEFDDKTFEIVLKDVLEDGIVVENEVKISYDQIKKAYTTFDF